MKIAVLLAGPWIPGSSVNMAEYVRVLRSLDHEAMLICLNRSEGRADFPIECVDYPTLEDPAFYRRLRLDAAIAFTWINSPGVIWAMKDAGMRVLLRGDSDGMISIRCFPRHYFRAWMSGTSGIIQRGRVIKHWLEHYFLTHGIEDGHRLSCIAGADVTVLETAEAARHIARFLATQHRSDLAPRLKVAPHFISGEFLTGDVPKNRQESVTCIGRWDDSQKNAPMLARAIELHLSRQPQTIFNLIGNEGPQDVLASLARKYPQVNYMGAQKPAEVRRILASSRVLLSASRWEGAPLVANEALAMGATVVGTPIPAMVDVVSQGDYGTVARRHSAPALAAALHSELTAWKDGRRNPVAIAAYWRPQFSPDTVVSRLIDLLVPSQRASRESDLPSVAAPLNPPADSQCILT
ncbi:MAG: glycosyltransferase [Tepidisphaeraceae bacterium]|jgi:glycosyltransferase involved in cell wall biosynthesis